MRIVLLLLLCIASVLAANECTNYCNVECDDPDCDDHNECTIDVSIGVDDGGSRLDYQYRHPGDSSKGCDHIARPPSTTCTIRPTNGTAVQGKCCDGLRLGCSHLESDVEHCGACGNRCRELILGAKVPACCGGVCADLFSSLEHCGMCGMSCPGGQVCMGGRCVADPGAPAPTPGAPPFPSATSSESGTLFETLTSFMSMGSLSLPSNTSTLASTTSPLPSTTSAFSSSSGSTLSMQPIPTPTPGFLPPCGPFEMRCPGSDDCIDVWNNVENCGTCERECQNATLCVFGVCVGEDACRRPSDCVGSNKLAPRSTDEITCNTTLPSTSNSSGTCCIPAGSQTECTNDDHCCGESAGCNGATGSCCKNDFVACSADNECCLGKCDPALWFCCKPLGTQCGTEAECCGSASVSSSEIKCLNSVCCLPMDGAGCTRDEDCCSPGTCSNGICVTGGGPM